MPRGFLQTRYSLLLALCIALPALALIWTGAKLLGLLFLLVAVIGGPAIARRLTGSQEHLLAHLRQLNAGEHQEKLLLTDDLIWSQVSVEVNSLSDNLAQVTTTLEQQVAERTAALERKASQLRAVGEVGRQVAGVLETEHLLHFGASVVRGTFGYDAVAVLLRRGAHLEVAACTARGDSEPPVGSQIAMAGRSPAILAVQNGQAATAAEITPLLPDLVAQSELAVPIALGGQLLGALVAQSRRPDAFDGDDRFTLQTVAGQLAVALENGRLLEAERQLRDLAIHEERNRMAREIHDTLAQGFMGILMQARAAGQVSEQPEEVAFHLEQIQGLASQNLQEARRSVWNLRPQPLEGRTLGEALAEEVASAGQRAAFDGRFTQTGDAVVLPPSVEVALLRAVQEALNNTIKHSGATEVRVHLTYAAEGLELLVADNGRGFDPAALPAPVPGGGGFGLQAMADRARTLGGTARLRSAPGEGTSLEIQIPLREGTRL